jgi:hypothetical protein
MRKGYLSQLTSRKVSSKGRNLMTWNNCYIFCYQTTRKRIIQTRLKKKMFKVKVKEGYVEVENKPVLENTNSEVGV